MLLSAQPVQRLNHVAPMPDPHVIQLIAHTGMTR
jgi:hypothetical protein